MTYPAKITNKSRQITQKISQETGYKQSQIIEEALLQYQRSYRLNKLNEEFEQAKQDKKVWKAILKEDAELEGTIGDGLDE
jgi:hypothetical protein